MRLRHLVVVVPGIGGSELADEGGDPRWDLTGGSFGRLVTQPGALDFDRPVIPTGLVDSFTALGPMLSIRGYESFVSTLETAFETPIVHTYLSGRLIPAGTDVLLVPYDFRQSMEVSATVLAEAVTSALAGVHASARRDRVIVVAHSMGGLVARYWLAALGGAPFCKALITLGTPHRGAPKAFDWLVNGPGAGTLRHPGIRRVLRSGPSVFEL